MNFKEWLKNLLGREPTEQEELDGKKLVLPPTDTPPTNTSVTTSATATLSDAVMQEMAEIRKTNVALLEKLNAEQKAREEQTRQLTEKAEAEHKAKIADTLKLAREKGIIPAENAEKAKEWETILEANFEVGSKALMGSSPITAGSPPASNQQNATGQVTNPAQAIQDIRQQAEAALSPKR